MLIVISGQKLNKLCQISKDFVTFIFFLLCPHKALVWKLLFFSLMFEKSVHR